MVRNSMNAQITPLFGNWNETNSNLNTIQPFDHSDEGSPGRALGKSGSGEQIMRPLVTNQGKLPSPRSDLKVDGASRKNSVTSIAMNSDERSSSNKGEITQKRSDSDSQEESNQKSLTQSGVSTEAPNLVLSGSHIQVPSPQFRGSVHMKPVPFQFHIDETDSEESFSSDERAKSAKRSGNSSKGSQGIEEQNQRSLASSKSQYQSRLSIHSADDSRSQPQLSSVQK